MKQKTIKAWVYLKSCDPIRWGWFCFPFIRVQMSGNAKTPIGAKRAVQRTIKRLGFQSEVEILRPKVVNDVVKAI